MLSRFQLAETRVELLCRAEAGALSWLFESIPEGLQVTSFGGDYT